MAVNPSANVASTPNSDSMMTLAHAPPAEQAQSQMKGRLADDLRAPPASGSITVSAKWAWPNGPWLAEAAKPFIHSKAKSAWPTRYSADRAWAGHAVYAPVHWWSEHMKSLNRRSTLAAALLAALGLASGAAQAQTKQLTLCWAAWDPANALVELSKDFTAQTGVQMKYEFVPWPNFAQRMLNELNSKGKLCDLLIGDSQWIGSAATEGHYIKLNEFFDKNGIKMSDFMPATVEGYSTWPKGTKNY
ncbi:MAG: multiple sugar transport system substrate-binding protein, partial [Acidimicrobiaceae bacterium]|nr:multiple sugar transport system substrate-binding protein [Acidimicrobiaceae bacterium]